MVAMNPSIIYVLFILYMDRHMCSFMYIFIFAYIHFVQIRMYIWLKVNIYLYNLIVKNKTPFQWIYFANIIDEKLFTSTVSRLCRSRHTIRFSCTAPYGCIRFSIDFILYKEQKLFNTTSVKIAQKI